MERPLSQPSSELERQLRDLLAHYPSVTMAFLFGSLAAGHRRMESDLDLAVHLIAETDFPPPSTWCAGSKQEEATGRGHPNLRQSRMCSTPSDA